ncbi:hypothetical protein EXIGLDRAFT_835971 [Exidia glandulosa HHB12029]|uniref:MYND-type domain-containing protein n=1 Tax=Exidia glandulosa HHB12029 TaxID=1314781 RepID=A0A165I8V7_EXIGL|nr:hypothetical protein EXIGLDRAFT_835971 [Exidia glandulosa HHB12029]
MDIIAVHLLPTLRDAHRPTFCVDCTVYPLEVLLKLLPTSHTNANALILRQHHHELLTTIMNFLTTPRSDEDLNILRDSLLRASSACPRRASHLPSPVPVGDIAGDALQALAYPISAAIETAPNLLRTQLFSRKSLWPRSAADLLPRPLKESLTTLLTWAGRSERSRLWDHTITACELVYILLNVCRPEILPELFVHDTRLLCIDVFVRQLDAATADFRNGVMSNHPLALIECVVVVFDAINNGVGSHNHDWATFTRDSEPRLIRALDAAWHCVDETTHRSLKQMITVLQHNSCVVTGNYELLSQPVLDGFRDICGIADVYTKLYYILKEVDGGVECNYRECKKHARNVEGGRLRKCGSCRLMRYCSRDCQKRHWGAEPLPHKVICPALKEIFLFASLAMDNDAFGAACRSSPRPQHFFQLVYQFLSHDHGIDFRIALEERLSGATD